MPKNTTYMSFEKGHTINKGRKWTQSHKLNMSKSKLAEGNGMFKHYKAGVKAQHKFYISRIPKPSICPKCKLRPVIDLTNISGEYKWDILDWQWLCRHCHMESDGRMKNLKQNHL